MKTPFACLLAILLLMLAPAPALAEACSLDDGPAATLLLPYFEVALDNPNGMTTLFTVNNASATAILANVVLWTDLGVPALGFNVYLTGYDVQTINLRDVFNGTLPRTASTGQDEQDTLSPQGLFSQDINFASCNQVLPVPPLPGALVAHLRAAHTGKESAVFNGLCSGRDLGDGLARGYVTVDTVNRCVLKTPADAGYFGPGGAATDQNVLWGDFFYVDPANDYADGENLVRVQAFPGLFKPGDATFYGRYVAGSGADHREPLATQWATRFAIGGAFSGGTELVVWRDSGRSTTPFSCGTAPAGFPLQMAAEATFDEQENIQASPPRPAAGVLPAEATRVRVGSPAFPVSFNFGWLYFDLNPVSQEAQEVRQAWVGTVMKAQGRFSVGFNATPLDTACAPLTP